MPIAVCLNSVTECSGTKTFEPQITRRAAAYRAVGGLANARPDSNYWTDRGCCSGHSGTAATAASRHGRDHAVAARATVDRSGRQSTALLTADAGVFRHPRSGLAKARRGTQAEGN